MAFPFPCPKCNQVTGTPLRTVTSGGTTTVRLLCADCEHSWDVSRPANSLHDDPWQRVDREKK